MCYCFPFAINPEAHNPSGELNFSKVSHAKLFIKWAKTQGATAWADGQNPVVDVYAMHYNWLQIKDGRALTALEEVRE